MSITFTASHQFDGHWRSVFTDLERADELPTCTHGCCYLAPRAEKCHEENPDYIHNSDITLLNVNAYWLIKMMGFDHLWVDGGIEIKIDEAEAAIQAVFRVCPDPQIERYARRLLDCIILGKERGATHITGA